MADAVESGAPVARRTSGLAIAGLVLGIVGMGTCGLLFIAGIPAVILGIVALVRIGRRKAELGGSGLAIAGIVTGGVSLFMLPVAAIAIPSLLQARVQPGEVCAAAYLRTYAGAQNMYRRIDHDDDGILEYARPYVKLYAEEKDGMPIKLIDEAFANASRDNPPSGVTVPKSGYIFVDLVGDEGGEDYDDGAGNFVNGCGLCAVPAEYGRTWRYTYVVSAEGTVFQKDTGGEALTRFPDVTQGWVSVGGGY